MCKSRHHVSQALMLDSNRALVERMLMETGGRRAQCGRKAAVLLLMPVCLGISALFVSTPVGHSEGGKIFAGEESAITMASQFMLARTQQLKRSTGALASMRHARGRHSHQPSMERLDVRTLAEFGGKMNVPSDSFGGLSPERKAAQQLQRFFTFCAVKIVLHQMEGISSNQAESPSKYGTNQLKSDYEELLDFYQNEPLKDSEEWVQKLMERNKMLALRVMEVRKAYAAEDFEWDWLQKMALQDLAAGNKKIMKDWAEMSYSAHPTRGAAHKSV